MSVYLWRKSMCRNIKTLYNFAPPANEDEIRAAALQYVRKVTGFNKPSQANEEAFDAAVEAIAAVTHELFAALETNAKPLSHLVSSDMPDCPSSLFGECFSP